VEETTSLYSLAFFNLARLLLSKGLMGDALRIQNLIRARPAAQAGFGAMVALSARLDEAKVIDRKVGDIAERYELGEMLGEGRFSKVYSATKGRMHVALKEMDMATLEEDEEAVDALVQETTALRRAYAASSKHVPKLHEVVQVGEDMLYVVMDQVRGCELFELLEGGSLSEPSARRLIAQLISALSSLHRHNVVHRDVKPENLMVSDIGDPSKCRLVVIDFGYAALETAEGLTELAGSPEYAAPEVLAWLDDVGQPYTKACDMWSVGVTAYVLLVGELPHDLPGEGDLYAHVRDTPPNFKQPFWSSSPEAASAKDFVLSCMQVETTTRLSAMHGLQHAWFAPRPDDNKSVVIGSSLAAFASLKRRVAGLSTVSSQKRRAAVSRWMGKLTVSMRRGPAHVQDQCVRHACPLTPPPLAPPLVPPLLPRRPVSILVLTSPRSPLALSLRPLPPPSPSTPRAPRQFWELKLGMPAPPSEQDESLPAPVLVDAATRKRDAERAALESQRTERLAAREKPPTTPALTTALPLTDRAPNAPALPEALRSARKLKERNDTDRQEEEEIKHTSRGMGATPRGPSGTAGAVSSAHASALQRSSSSSSQNGAPLASPRRALFLAPSPRRQEQLRQDALAHVSAPPPGAPGAVTRAGSGGAKAGFQISVASGAAQASSAPLGMPVARAQDAAGPSASAVEPSASAVEPSASTGSRQPAESAEMGA